MFKNAGTELGDKINTSSENLKTGITQAGENVKEAAKKIGNVEKAAETIKDAMIKTSLIVVAGIILNTIINKVSPSK